MLIACICPLGKEGGSVPKSGFDSQKRAGNKRQRISTGRIRQRPRDRKLFPGKGRTMGTKPAENETTDKCFGCGGVKSCRKATHYLTVG